MDSTGFCGEFYEKNIWVHVLIRCLTDITALQGRLDLTEPKITALQSLTATHTADILTKQDLITTSTDLECNSLTANNLEINGAVNIDLNPYFDTIVIRRPTGFSGDSTYYLGVR